MPVDRGDLARPSANPLPPTDATGGGRQAGGTAGEPVASIALAAPAIATAGTPVAGFAMHGELVAHRQTPALERAVSASMITHALRTGAATRHGFMPRTASTWSSPSQKATSMGKRMPTVCTERAGWISSAPSSERRPSSPNRRVRNVSAISTDASTFASRTSQAIDTAAYRRAMDALGVLHRVADLLDRALAPGAKVKAFSRAAEVIAALPPGELERRAAAGTLTELAGIGPSTGGVIADVLAGRPSPYLERLEQETAIPLGPGEALRA